MVSVPDHNIFLFFTTFFGVQLLYNAVLASAAQQSESATRTHILLFLGFPSLLGHHRAPSRVPCGTAQSH